jgi:hypothetical protein
MDRVDKVKYFENFVEEIKLLRIIHCIRIMHL